MKKEYLLISFMGEIISLASNNIAFSNWRLSNSTLNKFAKSMDVYKLLLMSNTEKIEKVRNRFTKGIKYENTR